MTRIELNSIGLDNVITYGKEVIRQGEGDDPALTHLRPLVAKCEEALSRDREYLELTDGELRSLVVVAMAIELMVSMGMAKRDDGPDMVTLSAPTIH